MFLATMKNVDLVELVFQRIHIVYILNFKRLVSLHTYFHIFSIGMM